MPALSSNDDYITKGHAVAAKGTKTFHGVMFDGAWDLLGGASANTLVSFVVLGMKIHKSTGEITRGRLGAIVPTGYTINNMTVIVDGDPDYYYIVSVYACNQHTSAQNIYLGFKQ